MTKPKGLTLRTAYDIGIITAVLVLSGFYLWKLLREWLALSWAGALVLMIPTGITTLLAAVWGYAVGWKRHYKEEGSVLRDPSSIFVPPTRTFERYFRLVVFGLISIAPPLLVLVFAIRRDLQETVVFLVLTAIILPWAIPRVRASTASNTADEG
jgi:hypothetical protein